MEFLTKQIDAILELLDSKEGIKYSSLDKIYKVAGTVLFFILALVVFIKGIFYIDLYIRNHYLNSGQFPMLEIVYSGFLRQSFIFVLIAIVFLLLVRVILLLKIFIEPFYILGFYAYYQLVKKIMEVAFSNDSQEYVNSLPELVKELF